MNRNKENVNDFIYIEPEWYQQLLDPNTFYILGSKGSGKTLYAAYMCADIRDRTASRSYTIDVTDYGKLIAMKTRHHLDFTEYLTMWKVILLQKFLLSINASDIRFWARNKQFQEVQDTISDFFGDDVTADTFNPVTVIDNCEKQTEVTAYLKSQLAAEAGTNSAKVSSVLSADSENRIADAAGQRIEWSAQQYKDTWARAINEFRRVIGSISFRYNYFLFVDGLDVRPHEIDAAEYSECIGALVRAVHEINTKILGSIQRKDDVYFKIVALTRTDIFLNSNLVNVTSCINDNCVELDWTYSNEREFVYSKLYKMMNRVLGWDGNSRQKPVEQYFNFDLTGMGSRPINAATYIQRRSRLRPRDVVVLLKEIQRECKSRSLRNPDPSIFSASSFVSNYSNYYTDQIKSEMLFQYPAGRVQTIFQLLKAVRKAMFTEAFFTNKYNEFIVEYPDFQIDFPDHRKVLDALYSLDLIGWKELIAHAPRLHWHYREVKAIDETYCMPWEQIKIAVGVQFIIHKGAAKHLFGTTTSPRASRR